MGLDRHFSDLPVGSGDRLQGWIERLAKAVAAYLLIVGIAESC
jgi:hypothetical protein